MSPSMLLGFDIMTVHLPPSLADIEELAQRALATIPRRLKVHLGPVVIQVEEFPNEETEKAMGLDSPFDILGLYRGVALPHKTVSDPRPDLDMVFCTAGRSSIIGARPARTPPARWPTW